MKTISLIHALNVPIVAIFKVIRKLHLLASRCRFKRITLRRFEKRNFRFSRWLSQVYAYTWSYAVLKNRPMMWRVALTPRITRFMFWGFCFVFFVVFWKMIGGVYSTDLSFLILNFRQCVNGANEQPLEQRMHTYSFLKWIYISLAKHHYKICVKQHACPLGYHFVQMCILNFTGFWLL